MTYVIYDESRDKFVADPESHIHGQPIWTYYFSRAHRFDKSSVQSRVFQYKNKQLIHLDKDDLRIIKVMDLDDARDDWRQDD